MPIKDSGGNTKASKIIIWSWLKCGLVSEIEIANWYFKGDLEKLGKLMNKVRGRLRISAQTLAAEGYNPEKAKDRIATWERLQESPLPGTLERIWVCCVENEARHF